jgi:uncharacterized membrane protein
MAIAEDSTRFGRALLAMRDDPRQTTVSELFVSSSRTSARNDAIMTAGQPGKEMFVITRGRVQLYYENNIGEKVVVKEMTAGEQFGEVALIDGESQLFTAVALDETEVLVLNRADFEELISRYPHLAIGLLTENCKWLRRLAGQLRDQSATPLDAELQAGRSFASYVADRLATLLGNPVALMILGVLVVGWMYFGQFGMQGLLAFLPFDPYPFLSLNLVLTILAASQAPVILMVLNRLVERERRKSDLDAEADARLEIELNRLQNKLDRNYEEARKQLAKLEAARESESSSRRSA